MVLPLLSVARMVTATGEPAVCGEAMFETTKWSTPLGITWIPGLVMPWIEPLVRSAMVSVCVPTVPRLTLNVRLPFVSTPVSGVLAAASFEVSRVLSADGTGFHQLSVDHTFTVNALPALWVAGEPTLPVTLPGSGDSPGTTSWSRANGPGCTMNGSLVPFLPGAASRNAYMFTLPRLMLLSSARYMVTLPLHCPLLNVTYSGVMRPSPKLVISRRCTWPENPVTGLPAGSIAVKIGRAHV